MATQVEEKEIFNKVLEEVARLVVERKVAGRELRIRRGELAPIYWKYAAPAGIPPERIDEFNRYVKSPEGREYFKKRLRLEGLEAGLIKF